MVKSDSVRLIVEAISKNEKGELLLLKRSGKNTYFKGLWQLPGGKVDFGENVQEAITREIKEETGSVCSFPKISKVFSFNQEFNGFKGKVFLMVFDCEPIKKVVLSEDHVEFNFFSLKEIKKIPLTPISKKSIFG